MQIHSNTPTSHRFLPIMLAPAFVMLVLFSSFPPFATQAATPGAFSTLQQQITDKEVIRNGNFHQGNGGWSIQPVTSGVQDSIGEDGSAALVLQQQ